MLVLASLVAMDGVLAGDTASAAPQPDSAQTAAPEKKICKRDVATGSVMPKRVCRTRAEWDAMTERSQQDLEKRLMDDRSRGMVGASR
jgi:hypothetical protein